MSARATRRAHPPTNGDPPGEAPPEPEPTAGEALDAAVMAYLASAGPCYCVEMGKALGVSQGRAKVAMVRLEGLGLLVSWLAPAPRGWQRRYYRLHQESEGG